MLEPRNFASEDFAELAATAPIPVRPHSQWSALPPLEIVLMIPVTAGLTAGFVAFCKSFGSELGSQAAKAFADWVGSVRRRAKEPDRDLMLSARFELPGGAVVRGYMPVAVDQDSAIEASMPAWADLAWFAEQMLVGGQEGVQQVVFIYDGAGWRLGWTVTTGDAVYVTRRFREHAPEPLRFLTPEHRALHAK